MSIYSKNNHRAIYESYYGPIPKDLAGRSYEVHHIDGNHQNNDIINLKCVTIREHFDIHYGQGDWNACLLIADRMKLTDEDFKRLGKLNRGKNNPSYDHTVYTFYHKDGRIEKCTQFELRTKYNLKATNLSEVINGNQKSVRGWRITEEIPKDMTGKTQLGCNTIYSFIHDSGVNVNMTQRELFIKYEIRNRSGISNLCHGRVKSYKGWKILPNISK
jgi:hypothetical protein